MSPLIVLVSAGIVGVNYYFGRGSETGGLASFGAFIFFYCCQERRVCSWAWALPLGFSAHCVEPTERDVRPGPFSWAARWVLVLRPASTFISGQGGRYGAIRREKTPGTFSPPDVFLKRDDISEESKRKLLVDNAACFFGL